MKLVLLSMAVTVFCLGFISAGTAETISEGFDNFQNGARPEGWTFSGCGQDSDADLVNYGAAAPAVRLDAYSDSILTVKYTSTGASQLSFYFQSLAANPSSALLVSEYDIALAAWTLLTTIENIPALGAHIGPLALNPISSQQVALVYHRVGSVDIVIDDVGITLVNPLTCTRIDQGFDGFNIGARPAGWTFTGCNANSDTYTTPGDFGFLSPSIKLDATGDSIETDEFLPGDWLQFWVKGQGTDASSSLLVEEYYAGWNQLTDISSLPLAGTVFTGLALNPSSNQVKFTYLQNTGNLALDDILIRCLTTPTPAPTTNPTPSATPTLTPPVATPTTPTPVPPVQTPTPVPPVQTPTPVPPVKTPTPGPPVKTPTPISTPAYLVLASSDFTGDGRTDIAIFRPSTGLWAVRGLGRVYFGRPGDIPVSGDYDGDGITDIAVFRPATGLWAIRDVTRLYFGSAADLPVPGDYTGDGRCDIAVFNPSISRWHLRGIGIDYLGRTGDLPVPGDYQGEGENRIAIFRPSNALWVIRGVTRAIFGQAGDRPVPGVFTWYGGIKTAGPFKTQIAVFRPSTGLWAVRGGDRSYFGATGDTPVIGNFTGNVIEEIGIFRPPSSLWAIKGVTRTYHGISGDLPL